MRSCFIHLVVYNIMVKTDFKIDINMNEIDHFKKFILYSDDVAADVDHLYAKRIY
jgi:hypothetical protein